MNDKSYGAYWALPHDMAGIFVTRVGSSIYPHIGNGTNKLVHISGTTEMNYQMGTFS